jgi:hypothetical protein
VSLGLCAAVAGLAPQPALAQQSVNFYLGGFVPRDVDARSDGDVLVGNLFNPPDLGLAFDVDDFNGFTFGGEWLFGLTDYLEGGFGIGLYSRGVDSVYADLTHANQAEIEQELKLRIVPITATVRFLPLGRGAAVEPYVGAGVGIFAWRYSEAGEFVDPFDYTIFPGTFEDSGATAGPVILGGLGVPIGSASVGFEVRWQSAQGELDEDQGFAGTEIDLGGFSYLATFKLRF